MNSDSECRDCGAVISADSPAGLCGKCLFGLGLDKVGGAEQQGTLVVKARQAEGDETRPPERLRESEAAMARRAFSERAGDIIGRYKLLQQIGEGGFGVVYMAQQLEPIKRRVALKIIKLGMDTRQVVARFDAERQALARMDHPNIAKVLDAGATPTGRPYFAMELVNGIKITDYCDQNKLPTEKRLELLAQVCRAVQHAHQKGIIHRDIKPSNILVTLHDGAPVPKVIDFGIAKATEQELTEQTVFTQFGHFLGTPAYVSPEQAEMSGLDVDTRSDIYSLGVLLYELLTGKTPFDAQELVSAGLDEMRRTIREKEPALPSTRLSTLEGAELTAMAKHRGSDGSKLVKLIRGDLDWIVMKCLEKDRTRRYETALNFAADLERFLKDEPITARPPSVTYRLRKLARRNKVAVAAATAVALAVIFGLATSSWMYFRERKARLQSQQTAFFLKDILTGIKPKVAQGRDTQLLREILDSAAGRVVIELRDEPQVEAELCNAVGEAYRAIGQAEFAERMHRLAFVLQGAPASGRRGESARSLDDLAMALKDQARLAEAEAIEREALRLRVQAFGPDSLDAAISLNNLGTVLRGQARLGEASELHRQALTIQKTHFPEGHAVVATSLNNLALAWREAGQYGEAERALREALAMRKKCLGEKHPAVALTMDNLAFVVLDLGQVSRAEELERQALEMLREDFGRSNPNDPNLATSINNLGLILSAQERPEEAEALCRQALEMRRHVPGDELEVAGSLDDLSRILRRRKQLAEAETMVREALGLRKKLLGDDHPAVAASLNDLAQVLQDQKRWVEAERAFHEALAIQQRRFGAAHPQVATTLNDLALLLRDEGKFAEAEQTMRQALAMREKLLGEQHPAVARTRKELATLVNARQTHRETAEAIESPL